MPVPVDSTWGLALEASVHSGQSLPRLLRHKDLLQSLRTAQAGML